jgi:hypothetical protein
MVFEDNPDAFLAAVRAFLSGHGWATGLHLMSSSAATTLSR